MKNMQTVPSVFTFFLILVSIVNGELVLDPACSSAIGCFHDCDSSGQSCTFLVTWVEEGDEVKFQIKAAMPAVSKKWLAVGFSADRKMGSDSVTACEIENTSDFGGDVYHSYNKNIGYSNQRLTTDEKLGIRVADFKLVDGIFTCEFYQTKAPANAPSEIFDLKDKWYIMYAYGDMDGDNKLRHSINPAPPSTPEQVNFTQTQVFAVPRQASDKLELDPACGDTKGCFHDCDGMGKQCTFIVIWEDKGLEVEVKIKTYLPTVSKKWFAIGFSEDMKMGSDSVTTCEIENTSNFGGDVYHSYNKDTGYSNQRLTTDEKLGIRVADFKLVDGIFTCEFYQTKAPANAPSEIFDLKDKWYIMYAYGDMDGDNKLRHSINPAPPSTPEQVNFTQTQVFAVPRQASDKLELDPACGDTKGCFHDCDGMGKQCTFIVIWEDKGLEVEVKIKTYLPTVSKKWFAIGFSEDMKMGSDSVTTCEIENTSNFGGDVYHSYNKDTGYSNQRLTTDEKLGIRVADFKLVDGIFTCEFYQTKAPANAPSEIFDLKDKWYIMYAYGDMDGDNKLRHSINPAPPSTPEQVNFTQTQVFAVPRQASDKLELDPACGDTKGCFHDCDGMGKQCTFIVIWEDKGLEVEVKIKTYLPTVSKKWFAIGFSEDMKMGSDSVTACEIENTSNFGGDVYHSYNKDTGYSNQRLTTDEKLGIRVADFKLVDGIFTCEFYQTKAPANAPSEIFDLKDKWYIMYAYGDMDGDNKLRHSINPAPPSTPEQVNFTQTQVFAVPRQASDKLELDPACGDTKGCFHDCDGMGKQCTFIVIWEDKGLEVEVKIKTYLPTVSKKWFAIGFSEDMKMGSDSVTACEIENTSDFGGDVYHSYNKDTGYSNQRLTTDEKLGIRVADFKLVDGIFTCEFYQTKAPANAPSEIFDLKDKWYIMYAYGDMNGGVKVKHSLDPEPFVTSEKVNFSQTQLFQAPRLTGTGLQLDPACGDTKGCFHDCDEQGQQCTCMVIWEDKGLEVEIKIKTYLPTLSEKWFAVGFSEDRTMKAGSVTECVIENTSVFEGEVYHSYNKDTGHANKRLTTDAKLGIRVAEFKLVDRIFTCEFYQTKAPANATSEIFDLNDEWYIMYAYGDMDGGEKLKHYPAPITTPAKVNFTQTQVFAVPQQSSLVMNRDADCGTSKGCFHNCEPNGDCTFQVSWKDTGDGFIDIGIKAKATGSSLRWFAVGFSFDEDMGSDSVSECEMEDAETVGVYHSWNEEDEDNNHRLTEKATLGLQLTSNSHQNGVFFCSFKQEKTLENGTSQIYDLEKDWVLLFASGPMGTNGQKQRHSLNPKPYATAQTVDLQEIVDLVAEEGIDGAIKAHAILMIIGMIFFASIGIVIARYYKPVWQGSSCWGKDVWFQIHRTVMIGAFLCSAAGFITIFAVEGEWVEIYGTNFQKAHPFCGVVAMAFFVINPLMAMFRCHPGDKNRQYFNWAHWFVGTTGHILGILTIFMGIGMEELGIPKYTMYILIAYVVYQFLFEVILECHQCLAEGKGKGRSAAYELKDKSGRQLSDVPSDSETPKPDKPKGSGFKRAMIYLHILIISGFTVAVAVIIGMQ